MEQVVTGTVQGNTIVLDVPIQVPDGQSVEVVVREATVAAPTIMGGEEVPPAWWTEDDDRILDEIYRARKRSTRREIGE